MDARDALLLVLVGAALARPVVVIVRGRGKPHHDPTDHDRANE